MNWLMVIVWSLVYVKSRFHEITVWASSRHCRLCDWNSTSCLRNMSSCTAFAASTKRRSTNRCEAAWQDRRVQEALVFIHGYNVSFENAVKRTAQIAYDLQFPGAPVCYSWPSRGGLADYTRDENQAEWTVVHLHTFLQELVQQSGAKSVHLIAHSMGNRAATGSFGTHGSATYGT